MTSPSTTTPDELPAETRFVCTAANPWTKEKSERATHPDAICVYDGGWEQEHESYECPHCNLRFKVTLSQ